MAAGLTGTAVHPLTFPSGREPPAYRQKGIHGDAKRQAQFVELARADAIDAVPVFVHLLERESEHDAELLLARAQVRLDRPMSE